LVRKLGIEGGLDSGDSDFGNGNWLERKLRRAAGAEEMVQEET